MPRAQLRGSAGFTTVAVLTLALGIGANAAIFSVFDAVLLRLLPYDDAERLYVIHETGFGKDGLIPANALHFRTWRESTRSFEEMALIGGEGFTLHGAGAPVRIEGARATPALFDMLGVRPALGRTFRDDEDAEGRNAVVVLSHELWTSRFGADAQIVGRTIALDETPHQVIGVLPAGFSIPRLSHFYALEVEIERPQIWKPFAATARDLRPLNSFSYVALARLKPGVTARQALEDLNAVQAELSRQAPEPVRFGAALVPVADQIPSTKGIESIASVMSRTPCAECGERIGPAALTSAAGIPPVGVDAASDIGDGSGSVTICNGGACESRGLALEPDSAGRVHARRRRAHRSRW